jgi:hypothetical protein
MKELEINVTNSPPSHVRLSKDALDATFRSNHYGTNVSKLILDKIRTDHNANGLSPLYIWVASIKTKGETLIFWICYKFTTAETMLVLTRDLECDRGKGGRGCLGCVEGVGEVGWLSDDGKAVIKVNAWR